MDSQTVVLFIWDLDKARWLESGDFSAGICGDCFSDAHAIEVVVREPQAEFFEPSGLNCWHG